MQERDHTPVDGAMGGLGSLFIIVGLLLAAGLAACLLPIRRRSASSRQTP